LYAAGFKILRAQRRKAAIRATLCGATTLSGEPGVADATDAAILLRHAVTKLERADRAAADL